MKHRQFHLLIISIILAGPIVTLIAWLTDTASFLALPFPITFNSINIWEPFEGTKEMSYVGLIVPLFMAKVLIIGAISWIRLYRRKDGGILLTRFYYLVLIISAVKVIAVLLIVELDLLYAVGILFLLLWIVTLTIAIRKHRAERNRLLQSVHPITVVR